MKIDAKILYENLKAYESLAGEEAPLFFEEKGLTLRSMDKEQITMFSTTMLRDQLTEEEKQTRQIITDLKGIVKLLKPMKGELEIILTYRNTLAITNEGNKTEFQVEDWIGKKLELPTPDYSQGGVVEINRDTFLKALQEFVKVNSHIYLSSHDKRFFVCAKGKESKIIKWAELNKNTNLPKLYSVYPIEYMLSIIQSIPKKTTLTITIAQDTPLIIEQGNKIFFIAPRVSNEDYAKLFFKQKQEVSNLPPAKPQKQNEGQEGEETDPTKIQASPPTSIKEEAKQIPKTKQTSQPKPKNGSKIYTIALPKEKLKRFAGHLFEAVFEKMIGEYVDEGILKKSGKKYDEIQNRYYGVYLEVIKDWAKCEESLEG